MSSDGVNFRWLKSLSLLISLLGLVLASTEQEAMLQPMLTPEDVRFAENRCQEDGGLVSVELKAMWGNRTFPDDHQTHCYVKCLLQRLGLIDLLSRGLAAHKLLQLWDNIEDEFNDECLEQAQIEEPLDGTCLSYYRKWMTLTDSCKEIMQYVLYDPQESDPIIYKFTARSKARGESATEFCEREPSDENVSAEVSDLVDDSFVSLYKCKLECVFQHFRYFDAYGRLDESEILRSFSEAHLESAKNAKAVRKCTHRANAMSSLGYCEMAYELQRCLQRQATRFIRVIQLRDKISRQY